jgi:hypothetical protein
MAASLSGGRLANRRIFPDTPASAPDFNKIQVRLAPAL